MRFPLQVFYKWYRRAIRHPKYRWWVILGSLVYLLSPLDIAPDVIPILGQIDDLAILTILFSEITGVLIDLVKSRPNKTVTAGDKGSNQTVEVEAVSVD